MPQNPTQPNPTYLIYMYKENLALNNLQGLIYHKTQPNQTNPNQQTDPNISNLELCLVNISNKLTMRLT